MSCRAICTMPGAECRPRFVAGADPWVWCAPARAFPGLQDSSGTISGARLREGHRARLKASPRGRKRSQMHNVSSLFINDLRLEFFHNPETVCFQALTADSGFLSDFPSISHLGSPRTSRPKGTPLVARWCSVCKGQALASYPLVQSRRSDLNVGKVIRF